MERKSRSAFAGMVRAMTTGDDEVGDPDQHEQHRQS